MATKPSSGNKGAAAPSRKQANKHARAIARAQKALDDARRAGAVGRPTAYRPEYAARATGLCLLGLTNDELGNRFGVSGKIIDQWIREVPEFAACVYDGREGADALVVGAAFKAATGYEHPEDDIRTVSLGEGMGSEIRITPTIKHYPPNYNFANLILINRQRQRWRHRESDSAQGGGAGDMTPEQVARIARQAIRAALQEVDQPAAAPEAEQE